MPTREYRFQRQFVSEPFVAQALGPSEYCAFHRPGTGSMEFCTACRPGTGSCRPLQSQGRSPREQCALEQGHLKKQREQNLKHLPVHLPASSFMACAFRASRMALSSGRMCVSLHLSADLCLSCAFCLSSTRLCSNWRSMASSSCQVLIDVQNWRKFYHQLNGPSVHKSCMSNFSSHARQALDVS